MYVCGRVLSPDSAPIEKIVLDVWHTVSNGMYQQQDTDQPDMDLRGRFTTDSKGHYSLLLPPSRFVSHSR